MPKLVSNPNDTFLKKVPEKGYQKRFLKKVPKKGSQKQIAQLFAQDLKKFETKKQ